MTAAVEVLAVLGVALFKFAAYRYLLYGAGGFALAACAAVLFARNPSALMYRLMLFAVAFFALVTVAALRPMLAAAALAAWGIRGLLARRERLRHYPLRRFFIEWLAAAIVLGWVQGAGGSWGIVAASALALVVIARLVSSRLAAGSAAPVGEAVAVGVVAVMYGFDPVNLAFLRSPVYAAIIAALTGFFIYKAGIVRRGAALAFLVAGTVVFIAAGHEAFSYYFLFTLMIHAGERLHRAPAEGGENSAFIPISALTACAAALSSGAHDPFPFYFAMAGGMGAGVFQAWGNTGGAIAFSWGVAGASLLAVASWLTSFIPAAGAPLILLASFSAWLFSSGDAALHNPDRDRPWLVAGSGMLAALLLFWFRPG